MDRCAILVDAGYLLGAAGTLVARDPDRSALEVDHAELADALIHEAEVQTGLPVLRLLWYDGAFNSRPQPEHRTLRVLADVKVRLGELVVRAGRVQQKGVDSYLQRDLTTLARNHAVADIVLLGGDEDLRRALEEAQDYGIRVHLWGVEAGAPEYNQSQSLIAEADRRWVIPAAWVQKYVRLRPSEPDVAPDQAEAQPPGEPVRKEVSTSTVLESPAMSPVTGKVIPASPEDLARLLVAFEKGGPSPAVETEHGWTVTEAAHDDVPRLRDIPRPPKRGETTRTTPRRQDELPMTLARTSVRGGRRVPVPTSWVHCWCCGLALLVSSMARCFGTPTAWASIRGTTKRRRAPFVERSGEPWPSISRTQGYEWPTRLRAGG